MDHSAVNTNNSRKRLFFFLRILMLTASVLILLKIVDLNLVIANIKNIPWYVVAALILIGIFRAWLSGLRWQLLNPDVSGQISNWQYFRLMMMAKPFNLIMPGALGGDFVRTAMTVNAVKNKKIDNVIAIIADRFVGLLSILILGTIAFLFAAEIPDRSTFFMILAFIYLAAGATVFIMTNSKIITLLRKIACRWGTVGLMIDNIIQTWQNAMLFFKANKKNVIYGLLLCLPIHIISFFTAYLLAQSLAIDVSFLNISLIIALVWIVTAIPITISGAGVRELSMIYLFSLYGVDAEPATALSIYLYIISLLLGLIGFLFIVDWGKWFSSIKLKLEGRQG